MKTKLTPLHIISCILFLLALRPSPSALSQIPQGFNYQAIVRDDGTNQPIVSQAVIIRITIEDGIGTDLYQETHSLSTDEFGIISIIIGQGTPWGTSDFNDIDWNDEPLKLKTEVQYPVGGSYTVMGTAPLMSVPYAMVADSLGGPLKNLKVNGSATTPDTEALFEVKNTSGQTVFAVYNEGVRIYVNDIDAKGAKGGFAIGGFGTTNKTIPHEYLFISGDSVRVYIDNTDSDKGPKGGFAIGGFGTAKAGPQQFLTVSNDSVRIYVDNNETDKGPKGGFAIGGYGTDKGKPQKLLTVSNDSVRVYINDGAKGPKGGFAIGGFDKAKGDGANTDFFNVSTDATEKLKPSEPRILWYPLKNAFLAGQVLIEHPDSVGQNSFAAGYEAKPKGDFSQALGFKARTEGANSTAIGNYAFARGSNSFALGDSAYVSSNDAYALGAGARATGTGSFAIGSKNKAFGDNYVLATSATGNFSLAMGLDADATGGQSFASGISVKAEGEYSVAIGRSATASGDFSMALKGIASGMGAISIGGGSSEGYNSVSIGLGTSGGWSSVAIGSSEANADYAVSIGEDAFASGEYATAVGPNTTAQAWGSFVTGYYNKISGTKTTLVPTDPIFVVGNGTYITPSNAFTVLKNGNTAVGHDAPTQMLDVNGQVRIRGGSPAAGELLTSDANGNATWEPMASHTHSTSDLTSGTLSVTRGGTGNSTLTANKVLVGNGTSAVIQPSNLHWNNSTSSLGIANSSPSYNIDIAGTAQITQSTYLATSSGYNVGIGSTSASTRLRVSGNMSVGTYNAATTNGLAVSGNVGIGTTSASEKLHIENTAGSVKILVNGSSGNSSLEYRVSGTYVGAFGANLDDDYIFIYHGGNVSVKDGKMGIGNTNPTEKLDITAGNGKVASGYNWLTNSDARYKKNVTELQQSLRKVMELRGVRFDLIEDENIINGQGKYIGFIAQEIEEVFPEFVVTGENGYKSVAYDKIGPVLVEAIKEQQKQIESQNEKIERLERMVQELTEK